MWVINQVRAKDRPMKPEINTGLMSQYGSGHVLLVSLNKTPNSNCFSQPSTGCPHKKYTEIKINIMAKLLYIIIGKRNISLERAECPLCNGIQLVMLLTQMSEQIRQMLRVLKAGL